MESFLILSKKRILSYWIFFCNSRNSFQKINYCFIQFLYWNYTLCNFTQIAIILKNIFTFILHLEYPSKVFSFIASRFVYSVILKSNFLQSIKKENGVFSNFYITNATNVWFYLNKLPSIVFFLSLESDPAILIDCKRKQILSVSFISDPITSKLVEYPLFFSSNFFFMQFFFVVYLFKAFHFRL